MKLHPKLKTFAVPIITVFVFGIAALVVGTFGRGRQVPGAVVLRDPVRAAHEFALDPSCQLRKRCEDGKNRSAVETASRCRSARLAVISWKALSASRCVP